MTFTLVPTAAGGDHEPIEQSTAQIESAKHAYQPPNSNISFRHENMATHDSQQARDRIPGAWHGPVYCYAFARFWCRSSYRRWADGRCGRYLWKTWRGADYRASC